MAEAAEMSVNVAPNWKWTSQSVRAVRLLAQGRKNNPQIASECDIDERQLLRWKHVPQFATAVKNLTARLIDESDRHAIGRRSERLGSLNHRWQLAQQVIAERAEYFRKQQRQLTSVSINSEGAIVGNLELEPPAPGATTGLLVKTQKMLGGGEHGTIIDEYEVDVALLKEIREIEEQAAKECGHRQTSGGLNVFGSNVQINIIEELVVDRANPIQDSPGPTAILAE